MKDSTLPTKEQLQDFVKFLAHSRLTNNHFYLLKSTI
jgi:hypothetical protein